MTIKKKNKFLFVFFFCEFLDATLVKRKLINKYVDRKFHRVLDKILLKLKYMRAEGAIE